MMTRVVSELEMYLDSQHKEYAAELIELSEAKDRIDERIKTLNEKDAMVCKLASELRNFSEKSLNKNLIEAYSAT